MATIYAIKEKLLPPKLSLFFHKCKDLFRHNAIMYRVSKIEITLSKKWHLDQYFSAHQKVKISKWYFLKLSFFLLGFFVIWDPVLPLCPFSPWLDQVWSYEIRIRMQTLSHFQCDSRGNKKNRVSSTFWKKPIFFLSYYIFVTTTQKYYILFSHKIKTDR